MKIVTLITARGGSKGIPRKNIIEINGRPLISYVISASLKSKVAETWVSTEDYEISKVAKKFGARVFKRNENLSNDTIMPDAAVHEFAKAKRFDTLVFIQPTSPLIKHHYIDEALIKMKDKGYDSIFSAHKTHWLPKWEICEQECKTKDWDINNRPRRQDIETDVFIENGMFYISKRENILKSKLRYSGKIGVYQIPLIDSFGIDSLEDLDIVKKLI